MTHNKSNLSIFGYAFNGYFLLQSTIPKVSPIQIAFYYTHAISIFSYIIKNRPVIVCNI